MGAGSLEYNVVCVKWGDKFSPEHVNRLYRMAKKNISLPFNFYCWTENTTGLYDEINVVPLDDTLDLKAWWWKLTLFKGNNFKGINLYLDLDVVIQKNIDNLFKEAVHNKLTLIDRSDENILENSIDREFNNKITTAMYNSSIMVWYNNENVDLYNKFVSNINLYTNLYLGIDRFFTYEILNSKFVGLNEKYYYWRIQVSDASYKYINIKTTTGSEDRAIFFNKNKSICVFNGCHEDVFYQNMEEFLL
tara:strand:- start:4087 stop:4830 length:744 start_codon:yes stop_codon:yes gene_type:complete